MVVEIEASLGICLSIVINLCNLEIIHCKVNLIEPNDWLTYIEKDTITADKIR